MDDDRLAAIEERMTAATPGPWATDLLVMRGVVREGGVCSYCGSEAKLARTEIWLEHLQHFHVLPYDSPLSIISVADGEPVTGMYDFEEGGFLRAEDAAFAAHSRQDVPDLVAEVRRLRALLEAEEGPTYRDSTHDAERTGASTRLKIVRDKEGEP